MLRVSRIEPVGHVEASLKFLRDPKFEFVTKIDFIRTLRIVRVTPGYPIFNVQAAGRRGHRFIDIPKVANAGDTGSGRPEQQKH